MPDSLVVQLFDKIGDKPGTYYNNLREKLQKQPNMDARDPTGLVDDYETIVSFLADTMSVIGVLAGLEHELRKRVQAAASTAGMQEIKKRLENPTKSAGDPVFKTDKLLSSALSMCEFKHEFNNPNTTLATLHSQALEYEVGSKKWEKRYKEGELGSDGQRGKNVAIPTTLPTGVPTVYNDLTGMTFNNILLRHGYQFKDVAAGFKHGEYTHRLQWYAICNANLPLKNKPVQIFKSMGLLLSGADSADFKKGKFAGRHLYVWQALFDCAETEKEAKERSTVAWSKDTFNCPETMNMALIDTDPQKYAVDKEEDLLYLRVLLKTRHRKRLLEGPQEPKERDPLLTKLKPAIEGVRGDGGKVRSVDRIYSHFNDAFIDKPESSPARGFGGAGLLVWYLRS
jgi:hypothetical protein